MKKSSFMHGAVIATVAIVISKILGIIYVIPFYSLIGEKGGALYGYAYAIYGLFLNLSTAGVPFAISKITSEYNALKQYHLKERTYKVSKYLMVSLGLIFFIILIIFAPLISDLFIGNIKGGNTKEDVTLVIRIISSALLVVPFLSVTRGYLQGHKFIAPSSISQVIEQFVRVVFIVVGSYLCLKVLGVSLTKTVGLSVFAATISAFVAYIYLLIKQKRNERELNRHIEETEEEKKITTKEIVIKLLTYSIPFILIDAIASLYGFVDMSTINKTMVSLGYKMAEAESVVSILSTWGLKLNMIVLAVSAGMIVSLVPTIASSKATGNMDDVKHKINQALQSLLYVVVPMTVGLSLIATPVWTIFFGASSELGPMVFSYSIFIALAMSIFNVTISTMHSLGYSKTVVITLGMGLVVKVLITIPFIKLFNMMGIHPAYGVITSTIFANLSTTLFNTLFLKKKIGIKYKETIVRTLKLLIPLAGMVVSVYLLSLVIPSTTSRLLSMAYSLIYGVVGGSIYLFISIKTKIIYEIFGDNIINRVLIKLRLKHSD